MKAYLRSVRIAPKKANLVAKMVRGMPVPAALHSLEHTNKKAARILEGVVRSAAANARQNNAQNPDEMIVKTIVVNKAITYHRGIPMARGRTRRIRKFLSHIEVTLGYADTDKPVEAPAKPAEETAKSKPAAATKAPAKKPAAAKATTKAKKTATSSSQKKKTPVKKTSTSAKTTAGSTKKSKTTDASDSSSSSSK